MCIIGSSVLEAEKENAAYFSYPLFLLSVTLEDLVMAFKKIFKAVFLPIALSAFTAVSYATDISFFIGAELPGSGQCLNGIGCPGISPCPDAGRFGIYDLDLRKSSVYGLRFGHAFVPYIGMEHTLAFSPRFLFPDENAYNSFLKKESGGLLYNSNLVFDFPKIGQNTVPFLTAGIGLIRPYDYGDWLLPGNATFALNYGGGVKFPKLGGPIGVRFDFRGYRANLISDYGELVSWVSSKPSNIFELSFGLMFSFDR